MLILLEVRCRTPLPIIVTSQSFAKPNPTVQRMTSKNNDAGQLDTLYKSRKIGIVKLLCNVIFIIKINNKLSGCPRVREGGHLPAGQAADGGSQGPRRLLRDSLRGSV